MAKTPEEVRDAWTEKLIYGDSIAWNEVLAELRSGELILKQSDEGILIRARNVDDR